MGSSNLGPTQNPLTFVVNGAPRPRITIRATIDILDSRAILRLDIGFYIGTSITGLTQALIWDPCPFGQPTILTATHMAFLQLAGPFDGCPDSKRPSTRGPY